MSTTTRAMLVCGLLCSLVGCDSGSRKAETQPPQETPKTATDTKAATPDDSKAKTPTAGSATKATPPAADGEVPAPSEVDPKRPKPDALSTATTAPKADDLARYTEGIEGEGKLYATIETSMGIINCELFEKKVPMTVANFIGLARGVKAFVDPRDGKKRTGVRYYDDTIMHRVIPSFMIQLGDRQGTGRGTPGYRFADEFDPSLKHDKPGMLSMANAGPSTNGSQFFVTEVPTPHLNNRHSVFGQCDNVALVKKIARVEKGMMDKPKTDVVVKQILFKRGEPAKK